MGQDSRDQKAALSEDSIAFPKYQSMRNNPGKDNILLYYSLNRILERKGLGKIL